MNLFSKKLTQNIPQDAQAGFSVALVALPMCLSISLASGFPTGAGLISSIIGGLIISFIAGSFLGIKGAPAGLSAIAFAAVYELGTGDTWVGYRLTLACIVIAGLIQVGLGLIKAGTLADFFPASVIHGMLSALGLMIALTQIPVLLGSNVTNYNASQIFFHIPEIFETINTKVAILGALCLFMLILFESLETKLWKYLPIPIVMLLTSVVFVILLGLDKQHTFDWAGKIEHRPTEFMINIPKNFLDTVTFPDFSKLFTAASLKYILLFVLIGSVESLLSAKALDKIDKDLRPSEMSRDITAVGIGNIISGFLGGLAMITAIRRSVVNVNAGGKTPWANFFHAIFLLVFVLLLTPFFSIITKSALASLLIFSGFKLVTPTVLFKSYKIGKEQGLVFLITLLGVLFFGLLQGIFLGIAAELVIHLFFGATFRSLFNPDVKTQLIEDNTYLVQINGSAIFSNFFQVKKSLQKLPPLSNVVFDLSNAIVVDHTFMEHIFFFETLVNKNGGQIEVKGLDYHKNFSEHPLASKRIVKDTNLLSSRQESIKSFAESKNYSFDNRKLMNTNHFNLYNFSNNFHIKYEENVCFGFLENSEFHVSDICITWFGKQDRSAVLTCLRVNFRDFLCPDFMIEKENYGEAMIATAKTHDINFIDYPAFSYYYLLKGPDEAKVRLLFADNLIRFFEVNKGYSAELTNNQLFVLRKPSVLNSNEIDDLLSFAQQLIVILKQNVKYEMVVND